MGYKFGEDVTATLTMLSDRLDQDTLFLYGFSMGAIAICNALGRPDLKEQLAQKGIVIERIIFDSPLANVKETLRDQASDVPLAGLYFDKIFKMYDDQAYGFGENMRMSKLLPNNVPVLILQSKNDHTTKNEFLSMELAEMQDHKKVGVIYFEGPDHVRIFQDNRTRVRYLNAVKDFLAEPR
jgi:alpha-beta hydrolase superfamily lysophospholipase